MSELSPALSTLIKYGPGIIYGHNTIQSYINEMNSFDQKSLNETFPEISTTHTEKRSNPNDEFLEIDTFRKKLMEHISTIVSGSHPEFPPNSKSSQPAPGVPAMVIEKVMLPIINTITSGNTATILPMIKALSDAMKKSKPTENWDIPNISSKLIDWMYNTMSSTQTPKEVHEPLLSLWAQFIQLHQRIEDIVLLARAWFNCPEKLPPINVDQILSDASGLMNSASICSLFEANPTIQMIPYDVDKVDITTSTSKVPNRRIAAHRGFVYVIDQNAGLVRIGTGLCGTIFSQVEATNLDYRNITPTSFAFCNEHLLLRNSVMTNGEIELIDPISFKHIGELTFSEPPGTGLFTAYDNNLYILNGNNVQIYVKNGTVATLQRTVTLLSGNDNPIIEQKPNSTFTLLSCGRTIVICNSQYSDGIKTKFDEFDLTTGMKVPSSTEISNRISHNIVCIDSIANAIICAPVGEPFGIIKLSPIYRMLATIPTFESTDITPIALLQGILPTYLSRYSLKKARESFTFAFSSPVQIVKLLEDSTTDKKLEPIADILFRYLNPFISITKSLKIMNPQSTVCLMESDFISKDTKVEFIRAINRHGINSTFSTVNGCIDLIQHIKPEILVEALDDQINIVPLLVAILTEPNLRVLKYAAEHSLTSYPFLSAVGTSVIREIFSNQKRLLSTMLIPFIDAIKAVDQALLPILVAPIMPGIKELFSNEIMGAASIVPIQELFTLIQSYFSQSDFDNYVNQHNKDREKPSTSIKNIIEESRHPYPDNEDYVHHYDFSSAQKIVIKFDERTATESGSDTLQIFKDKECTKSICKKMSGKFNKWTKEFTLTDVTHLAFKFHSDGSVNDWGYKCTITVYYTSISCFTSPQSYFDLSRNLFSMSLPLTQKLYTHKLSNNSPSIKYPVIPLPSSLEDIYISRQDADNLIKAVCEKYGWISVQSKISNYLSLSTAVPSSFTILKHLYENVARPEEFQYEHVLYYLCTPLQYRSSYPPDTNLLFIKFATFLIHNTIGQDPESYNYIYKALQNTNDGTAVAKETLISLSKTLQIKHISPSVVNQTAINILGPIQMAGNTATTEIVETFMLFLDAFSKQRVPVQSPLGPAMIKNAHVAFVELIQIIGADKAQKLLYETFKKCNTSNANKQDECIPFIEFALHGVNDLAASKTDISQFLIEAIMVILRSNMPRSIPVTLDVIKKYNATTTISKTPALVDILSEIGKSFMKPTPELTRNITFDIGPSFALSRALVVRSLLDPKSYDELIPIIQKKDTAALGALQVIAASSILNQEVRTPDGRIGRLVGANFFEYEVLVDSEIERYRSVDMEAMTFIEPEFDILHPPRLPTVSAELVKAICDSLNGSQSQAAMAALAEISHETGLSIEQIKALPVVNKPKEVISEGFAYNTNSLFERANEDNPLYRYTVPSTTVSFVPTPGLVFGFSELSAVSDSRVIEFVINDNLELCLDDMTYQLGEASSMTVSTFGDSKRLFVNANGTIIILDAYLSVFKEPAPYFIGEPRFNCDCAADLPIQIKQLLPIWTHVYNGSSLYQTNTAFDREMQFFPAIKPTGDYFYFEFSIEGQNVTIQLCLDVTTTTFFEQYYKTISSHNTYGIYLDFKKQSIVTFIDGVPSKESYALHLYDHGFTLRIKASSLDSCLINNEIYPFVADIESFRNEGLPIYEPSINTSLQYGISNTAFLYPQEKGTLLDQFIGGESMKSISLSSLQKPVTITSVDSEYFGRHGVFTSSGDNASINVELLPDYTQTTGIITLKPEQVKSMLDTATFNSVMEMKAFDRLRASMPAYLSPDLYKPITPGSFITSKKQINYFSSLSEYNYYIIMSQTVARFINDGSITKLYENPSELKEFIIKAAQTVGKKELKGVCSEELVNLFQAVYAKQPNVFDQLLTESVESLMITHGKEMLSFNNQYDSPEYTEIERQGAKYIFIRNIGHYPLIVSTPSLDASVLTPGQYLTVPGDLVIFENATSKTAIELDAIYADDFRLFAVQFISFAISTQNVDIVHRRILERLVSHITLYDTALAQWVLSSLDTIPGNEYPPIDKKYISCQQLSVALSLLMKKVDQQKAEEDELLSLADGALVNKPPIMNFISSQVNENKITVNVPGVTSYYVKLSRTPDTGFLTVNDSPITTSTVVNGPKLIMLFKQNPKMDRVTVHVIPNINTPHGDPAHARMLLKNIEGQWTPEDERLASLIAYRLHANNISNYALDNRELKRAFPRISNAESIRLKICVILQQLKPTNHCEVRVPLSSKYLQEITGAFEQRFPRVSPTNVYKVNLPDSESHQCLSKYLTILSRQIEMIPKHRLLRTAFIIENSTSISQLTNDVYGGGTILVNAPLSALRCLGQLVALSEISHQSFIQIPTFIMQIAYGIYKDHNKPYDSIRNGYLSILPENAKKPEAIVNWELVDEEVKTPLLNPFMQRIMFMDEWVKQSVMIKSLDKDEYMKTIQKMSNEVLAKQ